MLGVQGSHDGAELWSEDAVERRRRTVDESHLYPEAPQRC
jgi:hypothetical protein